MAAKRFYRSNQESMVAGICGGIAEYFDWDVSLVRLVTLLLIFAGGAGFVAYLVTWLIVPVRPNTMPNGSTAKGGKVETNDQDIPFSTQISNKTEHASSFFGFVLITLGLYFFLQQFFAWMQIDKLWPLLIVVLGIGLILKRD